MPKSLSIPTPALNRLRAAASLIPIIESGLTDGKLPLERAARMASFCKWAVEMPLNDPEQEKLAELVSAGLVRLKARLPGAEKGDSRLAFDA